MAASLYGPVYSSLLAGSIVYATDTIKAMICTSSYVPDFTTHQFKSSVTNEVVGTGYTARGTTLASKTATQTVANSWGTSRANTTAYNLGDLVRPATGNTFLYQAVVAGTSAGSIPTYPTVVGQTVVDGSVTWSCVGRTVLALDAADPSWPTSTITGSVVVIYKDTGTDSTSPLIAADVAGSPVSSTGATWTYTIAPNGYVYLFGA
jgi:hypothetical protein